MKHRPHKRPAAPTTYSMVDELLASATAPLPEAKRLHQLTVMWQGLAALETAPEPTINDWRVCSDAVNLMETLIRDMRLCDDTHGLLQDAVTAMAMAGKRHLQGKPIRLDGPGIQAVRAVLEDYAHMLDMLPHRTVVHCHRLTEKRLNLIHRGQRQPHDVEVMSL